MNWRQMWSISFADKSAAAIKEPTSAIEGQPRVVKNFAFSVR